MTLTTDVDATRITCDGCPNTIDATHDEAIEVDWTHNRDEGLWFCDCCVADWHRRMRAEMPAPIRGER